MGTYLQWEALSGPKGELCLIDGGLSPQQIAPNRVCCLLWLVEIRKFRWCFGNLIPWIPAWQTILGSATWGKKINGKIANRPFLSKDSSYSPGILLYPPPVCLVAGELASWGLRKLDGLKKELRWVLKPWYVCPSRICSWVERMITSPRVVMTAWHDGANWCSIKSSTWAPLVRDKVRNLFSSTWLCTHLLGNLSSVSLPLLTSALEYHARKLINNSSNHSFCAMIQPHQSVKLTESRSTLTHKSSRTSVLELPGFHGSCVKPIPLIKE